VYKLKLQTFCNFAQRLASGINGCWMSSVGKVSQCLIRRFEYNRTSGGKQEFVKSNFRFTLHCGKRIKV